MNAQKSGISNIGSELNSLYQNKCNDLVKGLQGVLEGEATQFKKNYTKYEAEVRADKESDAGVPKFHELKSTIQAIKEP